MWLPAFTCCFARVLILEWCQRTGNVQILLQFFKKGHRGKQENYRPVSLTSQVCKIFESIIRNAVVKHLETNMLILDSQHVFRKGRSCLTNLLVFLDKVTGSIDSGEAVNVWTLQKL